MKRVLVVGSGFVGFRRYLLENMARRHHVLLLNPGPVTWQSAYAAEHAEADFTDRDAVLDSASRLAGEPGVDGVLTWDESLLDITAEIAHHLDVRALTRDAARACRDKAVQRACFARHDVPSAEFRAATTLDEAAAAAGEIGYPVVVKPRALAGSIAVRLVRDPSELATAAEAVLAAEGPGFSGSGGLLVEEYLTGPEISVDSWVLDGDVVPFVLARKTIDAPPFFLEIGHEVGGELEPGLADQVHRVVRTANLALGIDRAVTHTELKLTPDGPRVVEVNGRLGGDLIPYLGQLATGVEAGEVVAAVATGARPETAPTRKGFSAVHFVYPPHQMVLDDLVVDPELSDVDWLEPVSLLLPPGTELFLPPRAFLTRVAAAVVTADDQQTLNQRLDRVRAGLRLVGPRTSKGER
ncbi:ATP-grasp domain-containing protein [Amycolatopsis sp. NPDC004079]|uniref:ATP-grasp domain-containing protein n=1 Tax=Amycolatopsis sp. NPDC004079 TaxID=3154549 RepID=UPI0033A26505